MQENAGNDVIAESLGGVAAPGVPDSPAVLFQPTGGSWNVDTGPGCAGPWTPVLTNQTTPTASPVSGGLLQLCVAGGSPIVHGTLSGVYDSGSEAQTVNTLPLETYVADTVPGESPSSWGERGRVRSTRYGLGLPGARGPGGGGPFLCARRPRWLRRVRRHLRPGLPVLPRHRVRDGDEHRRCRRHRRAGDGDAQRIHRHDRVFLVDRRLHLERQRGVALHRGARRRRRSVRPQRGVQPQPPVDDLGRLQTRSSRRGRRSARSRTSRRDQASW